MHHDQMRIMLTVFIIMPLKPILLGQGVMFHFLNYKSPKKMGKSEMSNIYSNRIVVIAKILM